MNTKQLSFLLLLGLASCQTSTTTSPLSEGQGGAASGGSSGASGEASGAAGEASAGGGSGTGGSSGAEDPATLCEGACTRLMACAGPPTYTVDIPKCTAQCVKEVTGQGSLIQEIGLDFYTGMKNSPEGCSYPRDGISAYWVSFHQQPEKLDKLKEPQVLQDCVDAMWECYQGPKSDYGPGCFQGHYRYNTELREKHNACFKQKCPDRYYCWSGLAPGAQVWLDGITENIP